MIERVEVSSLEIAVVVVAVDGAMLELLCQLVQAPVRLLETTAA